MSEASRGDHRARGHHGDPADSTISNTVTNSVTLGVAPYLNPLTITPTGAIVPPPAATGATALVVPASVSGAIVVNQGSIYGAASTAGVSGIGSAGGMGVQIAAPGTLTNSGTIVGGTGGNSYPVYPPPRGQIPRGPGGIGVDLTAGGMIMNTGTIIGGTGGGGIIPGTGGTGVALASGGTLTNTGTITGGAGGVRSTDGSRGAGGIGVFLNGGTLINSGTVAGGTGSSTGVAVQFGTTAATLVVNPGAVFLGQVVANATVADTLVLGGTAAGTLTGLGTTSFINFSSVAVSQSANWTFTGANTPATVVNNGTAVIASGGSLDVLSALDPTSTGVFQLQNASTLELAAALGHNTQIQFLGSNDELVIDKASAFGSGSGASYAGSLLEKFAAGDVIDLKGIAGVGTPSYAAATGDLQIPVSGGPSVTLLFQNSSLGTGTFHLAPDPVGGTLVMHY